MKIPDQTKSNLTFLSAIILAGGQASRMNYQDKGLILIKNKKMIEFIIQYFKKDCQDIIISANQHLSQYQSLGYPVYSDKVFQNKGPLGGIYQCIQYAKNPYILISPCDTPMLPPHFAKKLLAALLTKQVDIAVSEVNQQLQPAHILIKKSLAPSIYLYLQSGQRSLKGWLKQQTFTIVPFEASKGVFMNLNSEQDIQSFLANII